MEKLKQEELYRFKLFLLRHGRTEETADNRFYIIRNILRQVKPLNLKTVESFLGKLKERGLKNSSLNQYIGVIRWWAQFKKIRNLQKLKFLKREGTLKQILSDGEIERFLALPAPQRSYPKVFRMYTTFFSICAFTGMRPGEVSRLQRDDVLFERRQFLVRRAKTQAGVRIVPIPPNIIETVKSYTAYIRRPQLFINRNGRRINNMNWATEFTRRAKKMDIWRPNLTTYSLRHSLITSLIEEDVSLFKIRQLVGHKNIESTEVYVHLATKEIARALERHPIIRRQMPPQRILSTITEMVQSFRLSDDPRFTYLLVESEDELQLKVKIKTEAVEPNAL